MGREERTRFEVHRLKGTHWVLDGVYDRESEARRAAAALMTSGRGVEATRIVRDWLRPDGRHVETEIAVDRRPPVRALTVVPIDEPPDLCAETKDFYGINARIAMGRLLRHYSEHAVVTPSEILHHHGEMRRLADTGSLLAGAVGRVAVLQAEKAGVDGAARRDALYRAVDELDQRARWAAGLDLLPDVAQTGFAAAVERIDALAAPEDRDFLARVVLCRELVGVRNWLGKFDGLAVRLAEDGGLPERPMALADGILADVVTAPGMVADLIGPAKRLGDLLIDVVDLARGRLAVTARDGADRGLWLNEVLAFHDLPETRQQLLDLVRRQVRSAAPLLSGEGEGERAAFLALLHRLVTPQGVLGGAGMAEALVRRALRFEEGGGAPGLRAAIVAVDEALPDGARALLFLLTLAGSDLGREHAGTVVNRLDRLTGASGALERLLGRGDSIRDSLAALTGLHGAILAAPLPEATRLRLADAIDERLVEFIVTRRVVERLDAPEDSLRARADRLVRLCAPGTLRSAKALGIVRHHVIKHLRQPNFEDRYTEDIPEAEARERALRGFHDLLARAGFR